jgi:hypothetical protein
MKQEKQINPVELEQERIAYHQTIELIHTLSNLLRLEQNYRTGETLSSYNFHDDEHQQIKDKLLTIVNEL